MHINGKFNVQLSVEYWEPQTKLLFDIGSCTRTCFYTPPPAPSKMDKKCHQKAELGFAKCNLQNSDKKYSAYGVRTKQL